ncbi:MAG: DNA sulfur modification protein DndB [Nostoc sp.]|uniref:DNA sulfur modification protein DndB n=1 Tax=Nostoc sp. TaxID=1180 RepID=UPI002FFD055A
MFIISNNEDKARYNKPLYGLTGTYTLSEGIALPYFLSLLEINRAIDELEIAEQIPASLDTEWSLKELFQREIDEKRVKDDIVKGYLLDPKKLKFFNAITIVLMPKGTDGKIQDSFDNSASFETPPIPWDSTDHDDAQWNHSSANIANFSGVQFVSIGLSARLRWDEDRVLAVAVDGQHRLWALRTFREDPNFRGGTLNTIEQQTKIPVMFVLLHPSAGFQNVQGESDYSIRGIARELFTDLNKNAKTVDKARELILDDKSINAQCVRTLVTERTAQDAKDRLPLSLVRWQDDSHKFDTSYYLNSLVHLDLLVSAALNIKPPRDPMETKQVKEFIDSINDSLGVGEQQVQYEGRSLYQYYLEDYCDDDGEADTPFSRLPEHYLDSAIKGFEINFRPWLIKLLLDFKPYRNLLKYAREHNLVEGTFGRFQAQTSKHKANIKQQENARDSDWHNREILTHQNAINGMKDSQWAFKAIFQKAMVRLGRLVEFDQKGKNKNLGNIDDVLSFLDRLYEQGILKVDAKLSNHPFSLWTFIATNQNSDKIKVAKTVEDRIFYLLCLWYFGTRKIKIDIANGDAILSKRKLLKFFSADTNKSHWTNCNIAYQSLYKGFDTNAFYGKEHEQMSDERKRDMVRDRFSAVLAAGLSEFYSQSSSQERSEDDDEPDLEQDV